MDNGRRGHWVFGGIECDFGKCFLVEVPDRTVETLRAAFKRRILPGSHIISGGRAPSINRHWLI